MSLAEQLSSGTADLDTLVARMAKVGSAFSPSFSPDGKRVAFVSNLTGVAQVWTVASEGGWPELVTPFDDPVTKVLWSPDGEWLAFMVAPGGGMNQQVYLVRPDGSELQRITAGGKDNNWLDSWLESGKALAYSSSLRRGVALDSIIVEVPNLEKRYTIESAGIAHIASVSRDGKRAIVYRLPNRSNDDLYLVDLESGQEFLLTPHEGPGHFDDGSFSPDGSTIYLLGNAEREMTAFCRIKLDKAGKPGPIEVLVGRDEAELQDFKLTHDGQTALLVWNKAGKNEVAFFDLTTLESTPGPQLPAEVVVDLDVSQDGRLVALTLIGSTSPMDIWLYERSSGKLQQLTHSPHAGVNLAALVRPEAVSFKAHDGLELTGWLYRPGNFAAPGPVVLSFHGGPEGQERPNFNSVYQGLLSQGIAVLAPNVRGSSGFGKTFVNLDNGPLRFNAVKDIEACVNYVVQAGIADQRRIGIMGGSYGGYMTMAGLTEYPELLAAGANLYGIVNFETFFTHTEPWMAAVSKIEYGDPETEADLLRQLSPIYKLDRVKAPTLVLHGANDTNVPVIEAEQVVEHLKKRGVTVDYILFPDEGHGFRKAPNRITANTAIVRWFAQHL